MSSRQKAIGTRLESAVEDYAQLRTGDRNIRRFALKGQEDFGDVGWVLRGPYRGTIECKNYKIRNKSGMPNRALLAKWQSETVDEMGNSGSDFAMLVVHRRGCNDRDATARSFRNNWCWATRQSLVYMAGESGVPERPDEWVLMTVGQAFDLICS